MMDALTRAKEYLANQAADGTQRTMHAGHPDVLLAALVAEMEGAVVVDVYSVELQRALMAMEGQRVRLLALDSGGSKGGGNLPPPLGGGDGG